MRGTPAELEALAGQRVDARRARGQVPRPRARAGPGRGQPDAHRPVPARRARREGAVGTRGGAGVRGAGAAARRGRRAVDRGRAWLPDDGATVIVRYRDPTQMGKVYLLPAGVERRSRAGARRDGPGRARPSADHRGVAGAHPEGTRASSRTCCATRRSSRASATPTRTRSCSPRGSCRSASARRSPRRRSTSCTRRCGPRSPTRSTLLRERVPPTFEKQVRDHLSVHNKGGEPCPRCGTKITAVKAAGSDRLLPGLPALAGDARLDGVRGSAGPDRP